MTVFLSYSREDIGRLDDLTDDLEKFGATVWRDEKLSGGVDWWKSILERILESETFVLAVSASSLLSEACASETEYAAAVNRQIIPVRLEDAPITLAPSGVAEILSRTHWIDYRSGQKHETIDLLRALTEGEPGEPPSELPPEPRVPGSYVTDLLTEVDASAELSLRDQRALFFRLKDLGEVDRDREAAEQLMAKFRGRDDLRTKVSDEVDAVLSAWRQASSEGHSRRVFEVSSTETKGDSSEESSAPTDGHESTDVSVGTSPASKQNATPSEPASKSSEEGSWKGSLVKEGRLLRTINLELDNGSYEVSFRREGPINKVLVDGSYQTDWRMASSTPWEYSSALKDGGKAWMVTMTVEIKESVLDRIVAFELSVDGEILYTEP